MTGGMTRINRVAIPGGGKAPQGCTVSGLNEMENRGFSSAMVRGIIRSADKAGGLYQPAE